MARSSGKGNKFSSIASNTPRNLPFRETLSLEERVSYDKLSNEQKLAYEQFCKEHASSSVADYLQYMKIDSNTVIEKPTPKAGKGTTQPNETKKIEQPIEKVTANVPEQNDINDYNPVRSVQSLINKNLSIKEEAGKNISVYLSSEALKVIDKYMKTHKVSNRSKLIETVLINVLQEK